MPTLHDPPALWLMAGVFGLLAIASIVGYVLGRRIVGASESTRRTVANLNARLRAWWVIVSVCALTLLLGRVGGCVLFGLASLWALREFLSITLTRSESQPALFWVCLIIASLQYTFVVFQWYGMFVTLIPVCALLFIPAWLAVCGEHEHYLDRVTRTQWGLMICVYCVSYAPALLTLQFPDPRQRPRLLLFFLLVVELSDVCQYLWGKWLGRHKIAPQISPNKTWEGFIGGVGTATGLGTGLWWITPFNPWQAAGISLVITLLGFAGGLTMSAIKRERGVKDFGTVVVGHGGMLDRLDSLCFAAPVFFHLTRYCFT